jgi:hypothetical protein
MPAENNDSPMEPREGRQRELENTGKGTTDSPWALSHLLDLWRSRGLNVKDLVHYMVRCHVLSPSYFMEDTRWALVSLGINLATPMNRWGC